MIPRAVFSLTLFLCAVIAGAQSQDILLGSRDLPGWTIDKAETYNDRQLYGYINGGAELYLEYGFRQVVGQRCSKGEHEFVVDVYEMVQPQAAFGMWTLSRRPGKQRIPGIDWSSMTDNQLLFVRGKHMVNITLYDSRDETRNAARSVATLLHKRIGGMAFRLPKEVENGALAKHKDELRFVQGPLALASAVSDWSDLFDGIARFDLYHWRVGKGASASEVGLVTFKSQRDLDTFLKAAGIAAPKAAKSGKPSASWLMNAAANRAVRHIDGLRLWFVDGGSEFKKLLSKL